jgi:hypothetical protein
MICVVCGVDWPDFYSRQPVSLRAHVSCLLVWQFEWMRFDHVNPVAAIANYCDFALSAAALHVLHGSEATLTAVS